MQELHHQTSKTFKGTRNSNRWADLDENALGGMDVDLKSSRFVDGGIEEGEKTLR